MNALVEATPISGPACVRIVPAASRVIIEPMTLQMASGRRAFLLGFALCGEGVGGFAGLADADCQAFSRREWDRDSGIRCRNRLRPGRRARRSIMNFPARPACQLVPQATMRTFLKFAELLFGDVHFVEKDFAGVLRDAAEQSVAHGAGLLENFLLHEMLVAALFRHDGVPGDVLRLCARRGCRRGP